MKELKALAKERSVKGYYKMRKAELIKALSKSPSSNVDNQPIPEVNIPIPAPSRISQIKNLASNVAAPVKSVINRFTGWLLAYIPEPIKNAVNERVENLKERVNSILRRREEVGQPNEDNPSPEEDHLKPKEHKTAIKGYFKTFRVDGIDGMDEKTFMNSVKNRVIDLIESKGSIKVKFILTVKFTKENPATGNIDINTWYFSTDPEIVTESTDLSELYDQMTNKIFESIQNFQNRGSGWQFDRVEHLDININPYNPLSGSSYIPLPKKLADKNAIINVKNDEDNECFKWAITSAVFPAKEHGERLGKRMRKNSEKFDWKGIEFPVSLKLIDKFEKQNPYTINVFGYERVVYPLRLSKKNDQVINLLLIANEETNHFCWIKNMSRLISSEVNNHQHKRHFCYRCLNSFPSVKSLNKHNEYCQNNEAVKIEMPMIKYEGKFLAPDYLKFNNHYRKQRVPFVVYADFECFTQKIHTCQPKDGKSFTNRYQKHKPSGFSYLIKCFDDNLFSPKLVQYTADSPDDNDVPRLFIESLESDIKEIYNRFKIPKKMVMTQEDEIDYMNATHCHICEGKIFEEVDDKKYKKVRDHCHLTGKYRGAAHSICNLKYRLPKFYPVIFHNLSGYDSHLFIKNLGKSEGKIDYIPNNEEKYISFTKQIIVDKFTNKEGEEKEVKRDIRFIDSFKFMAASLDSLVNNLPKESFKNLTKIYEGDQLNLLLRKGVFPYDWFDSFDRLLETNLPPKEAFHSILNDSGISEEDYQHAQKVWETYRMKTMRDYHDLYLESDVLLLSDVFENFRDVCMENYHLDPAFYYTAPGLAWDACLKNTKVRLELLTDYDLLMMVEKGIRGGVSMISTRYGKANNPYMNNYDPDQPTKYISYLDANNLYGWAMCKPLPTHCFEWMKKEDLKNWKSMPCILEVDLKYPEKLHDLHNDYPLAPERLKVNEVEKLIPNLNDKTKYVIHHETLKLYLSLGLKLTKIHRGITFEESAWLKPYIDLNTDLRAKATNDFEKDFFKLMNNSVFGKTMENIRNRVDIRLVTRVSQAKKLTCKPNYQHQTIYKNLAAVHMKKVSLYFNKPVYLGMSILDLSKTLMYDFHYNYIKPKYGENAKLLFTDTDSLAYEIETEDFYNDISSDVKAKFDTSNYPKNHPSRILTGVNKKVIGMFKDEAAGKQIAEFVGLRAKLYSYRVEEGYEEKKCKGIKKAVIKKTITFEDYKDCLFNNKPSMRKMNVIRSHLHTMYTETVNKIALSPFDDKRIIREDNIHTFAYGYKGGNSVSDGTI